MDKDDEQKLKLKSTEILMSTLHSGLSQYMDILHAHLSKMSYWLNDPDRRADVGMQIAGKFNEESGAYKEYLNDKMENATKRVLKMVSHKLEKEARQESNETNKSLN